MGYLPFFHSNHDSTVKPTEPDTAGTSILKILPVVVIGQKPIPAFIENKIVRTRVVLNKNVC